MPYRHFLFLILSLSLIASTARAATLTLEEEFLRLDSVVENAEKYVMQKRKEIKNIKRGIEMAIKKEER